MHMDKILSSWQYSCESQINRIKLGQWVDGKK